MLDNKSEQSASAVIQPLACNPRDLTMSFYQTGDLVRAERNDLADDSSTMRGKG